MPLEKKYLEGIFKSEPYNNSPLNSKQICTGSSNLICVNPIMHEDFLGVLLFYVQYILMLYTICLWHIGVQFEDRETAISGFAPHQYTRCFNLT